VVCAFVRESRSVKRSVILDFLHVFGPACIRFLTPIVVTDPEMLLVTSLPAGVAA